MRHSRVIVPILFLLTALPLPLAAAERMVVGEMLTNTA
jgi:hypothetical protein